MNGVRIGRIAGVPLSVDWSVLVIAWLLTWGLAAESLPDAAPGYSETAYWVAGVAGAVLLLASLLVHELAHAVVARRAGVPVQGITLWMFGGMASLGGEAANARDDLRIALVGPLASAALGVVFTVGALVLEPLAGSKLIVDVVAWLGGINFLLAVFNLVPGAPLDGGRVLRAVLWRRRGDRVSAAVSAARAGRVVAYGLVALGFLEVAVTSNIGGLWLALIGLFVLNAARAEESDVVARNVLDDRTVGDVMTPDPATVPEGMTVEAFVEDYVLGHRHSAYPVTAPGGAVIGLVSLAAVRDVPAAARTTTSVGQIATSLDVLCRTTPGESLVDLIGRIDKSNRGRALVFDGERLVGIITSADVARAIEVGTLVHAGQ